MRKSRVDTKHGDQARQDDSKTQYHWIRVKKILLPKSNAKLDEKTVAGIAESIQLFGQLHPIAVRRVTKKQEDGETTKKIVLVAGAHRLEAVKRLGRKKVPCSYVEGDETDAQLVQLGENLWRKTLTVLRHAEGFAEYIKLASAKLNISGQLVEKSEPGRPPGGIALAARELPLVSRSAQARWKIIDRAIKINRITPEAKEAAIEARLDDNQRGTSEDRQG
jgi:ParB-like chromosome segregation protein Spo0J